MIGWSSADAPAKINLALVVGPLRGDGRHELVTVLTKVALADTISVRRAAATRVDGFAADTLVRGALDALSAESGGTVSFEARIEKRVPVAAGLGGGSSDAATALAIANDLLDEPLSAAHLERLAARLGADVPFFLREEPCLGTGDGTTLEPARLPTDYAVVLALADGAEKESTGEVYASFDARAGHLGFDERRRALLDALAGVEAASDLASLPPNDLASSPLAAELESLGALRADVTGAGPVVYGLFGRMDDAEHAAAALRERGRTWVTTPG